MFIQELFYVGFFLLIENGIKSNNVLSRLYYLFVLYSIINQAILRSRSPDDEAVHYS